MPLLLRDEIAAVLIQSALAGCFTELLAEFFGEHARNCAAARRIDAQAVEIILKYNRSINIHARARRTGGRLRGVLIDRFQTIQAGTDRRYSCAKQDACGVH